jgi:hypothetical protein
MYFYKCTGDEVPKGRNYDKRVYWVIPVDRDSILYERIMRDAHELSMESSVPKLLVVRISEYYERRKQQRNHSDDEATETR